MTTVDNNYIPQVDYTSRDYTSIRQDLINSISIFAPQWTSRDTSDFGIVLLEIFAYMGDLLNYYIDRAANEAFIQTASQRDSVLKLAEMLGYIPTDSTAAVVSLAFSNNSTSTVTVPAGTQVASSTVINGSTTNIIFETETALTLAPGVPQSVSAVQGYTVSGTDGLGEIVGTSDGTAGQTFTLAQGPVIVNSIQVVINQTVYQQVPYLAEVSGTTAAFTVYTDSDYNTTITFGDGIGGRVPPNNAQVYATYRVGGGAAGNVPAGSITKILTNYSPGLTVINNASATGGADPESTDSIRTNAPKSIRSVGRAVSLRDYGDLAVQVPGVAKAVANALVYTNVNLYIAPFGGTGVDTNGNLTTGFTQLATNVLSYLQDKTPPNTTVTVFPPSFVGLNINVTVHCLPQYRQSVVYSNALKAINQILSFDYVDFGQLISLHYINSALAQAPGVDYANVTLIARADATQAGTLDAVFAVNELPQAGTINVTVDTTTGIAG